MREQQQEAYAACLRAIYAHPHLSDPLEMDAFLTSARKMLHITNPGAILESVRTDLELIRQGQVVRAGSGTPVMGAGGRDWDDFGREWRGGRETRRRTLTDDAFEMFTARVVTERTQR